MNLKKETQFFAYLFILVMLSACIGFSNKGGYYQDDGPPRSYDKTRVQNAPNAVPRQEPLSKTGNAPYTVFGRRYVPLKTAKGYRAKGTASWYGKKFHGRRTSSGESYDMYAMSAAHPVLPLPAYVRVTNLRNNRQVIVKVNDRGPFLHNRLIDLSYAAAVKLDMLGKGTADVLVEAVTTGNVNTAKNVNIGRPVYTETGSPARPQPVVYSAAEVGVGDNYVLQVGAFVSEQNALSIKLRLQDIGFNNVFIKRVANNHQAVIYRVQLGPYSSNQVQTIRQRLAQLGFEANPVQQ